eukprot:gene12277-biopygen1903
MSQVVKTLFTSCNKLWWPHKLSQVVEPFFYVLCADNMVAQTQDVTSFADLSKNERVGGGGGMEFPVWRKEFPPARAGVLAPNVDSRVKVRPGSAQTTLAWLICPPSTCGGGVCVQCICPSVPRYASLPLCLVAVAVTVPVAVVVAVAVAVAVQRVRKKISPMDHLSAP